MKQLFLLAIALLIFACSKNNDIAPPSTDVYVAGYSFNSAGKQIAKFWKNGVATSLTDGTANAGANGIAFSGPSLIVSGWDWSNNAVLTKVGKLWVNGSELEIGTVCFSTVAVAANSTDICVLGLGQSGWAYWRNGNPTTIIDTVDFQATGIAVNDGDVYVSGFSGLQLDHRAQYWRNSVLVYSCSVPSAANAIAVSGSDVFLAGYKPTGDTPFTTAVYWKNGTITELTNGQTHAKANAIFISGSDVFVAGSENNFAMIWKNGTPINLTDGSIQAEVKSIAVKGDDLFAAGYEGAIPRLWKNSVVQNLADGNLDGAAMSIVLK